MSFVSWAFVALFLVVFAARLTIGRRKIEPSYVLLLVIASTVFYGWHVPAYLAILVFSSAVDYWAGLALGLAAPDWRWRRRALLTASLTVNLGLLGFFKYANLALDAAARAAGWAGYAPDLPEVRVVLPMGISFYTFQSMSYTIDVYRGRLAPIRGFWPFYLYISFFPQLVAGPIVRALDFLPQMPKPRRLRVRVFYEGAWLVVTGFFLKMVCADNLAVYVERFWDEGYRDRTDAGFALWLALLFSGQIFADFAGYSSIARGLAYMLGYRLPINFDAPYVAGSFKNFWERWHITLSSWLRDYLYVPLGGNRRGRVRTYVNLVLVMVLGGLWHGAAYTFIVWGAIHGAALAVERALGLERRDGWRGLVAVRLAWFLVTQAVVLVAWVFFRSETIEGARAFVGNLVALDPRMPEPWMWMAALFLVPLLVLHAWTWALERRLVRPLPAAGRAALAAAMVYAILTLYAGTSDFIYFQF